jgi:hypothetical protein
MASADCDCNDFDCDPCFARMNARIGHNPQRSPDWTDLDGKPYGGPDSPTVADLRSRFHITRHDNRGRYNGQEAAQELLRGGMTFEQAAAALECETRTVVRLFTQSDNTPVAAVLQAEALLRAGAPSSLGVAKQVGLTNQQVSRLAEAIGVVPHAAATRRAGGGTKYSAQQIAQTWALRDQGLSYAQIAERCDWLRHKNDAVGLLRRNANPSEVAA